MGQEAICRVEFAGRVSEGRAQLETNELQFRGDFRLKIARAQIEKVQATDGKLSVQWPEGTALFYLGAAAPKWAAKILNPPTRLDKLGVKPGTTFRAIGSVDADFVSELQRHGAEAVRVSPDIVFVAVNAKPELQQIAKLRSGVLWVIYPKGLRTITENDVLAAGRSSGRTDVKVASFSPTHTALKFVARRQENA